MGLPLLEDQGVIAARRLLSCKRCGVHKSSNSKVGEHSGTYNFRLIRPGALGVQSGVRGCLDVQKLPIRRTEHSLEQM
jgi:hypothetical protein